MYDQMVKVDSGVAQLFAANESQKLGQTVLTGRLDCLAKPIGEQQAVAVINGAGIGSMSLARCGCTVCGVAGAIGVQSGDGCRPKHSDG